MNSNNLEELQAVTGLRFILRSDMLIKAVVFRDPYRDFTDLLLEQAKCLKCAYGKICFMYLMLKLYFHIDFQRYYSRRCHYGMFEVVLVLYFLTFRRNSAMKDKKLITETVENVKSQDCDNKGCRYNDCPLRNELIRRGILPDDNAGDIPAKDVANTPLEDWIDSHDVMRLLHISQRTLQTLRSNGMIKFSKLGKKIYYRRKDIQNILAQNHTMFEIVHEYGKKRKKTA